MPHTPAPSELSVLALVKGPERFVFVYDALSAGEALNAIRDSAANPALKLNWSDAALLAERLEAQVAGDGELAGRCRGARQ